MKWVREQIHGMFFFVFFLCKFGVRVVYKSCPREYSLVLKEQQDQNVARKDKKKEAERQRGIRIKKKKETEKLKAFWAYAQEKIPDFVGEFLVGYEQNSSSTNHKDQATKDQETPKGTEDQETPPTIIGRNFGKWRGAQQSNFGLFERCKFGLSK